MPGLTFGQELPDQLPRVQAVVSEHISFLLDVREFLKERVALERQYGQSLQAIVRKAAEKRTKREQALSVGLEPSKAFGSSGSSTLDAAWSRVLAEADESASDHMNLADAINNEIVEVLKVTERKKDAIRKKHSEFATHLVDERDRIYADKDKAKRKYDEACSSVESSRVKQGHAKDDKRVSRANRSMDSHSLEMAVTKNAYLVAVEIASAEKTRFFQGDLPQLHNDFQALWTVTTKKAQGLLLKVNTIHKIHHEQQAQHSSTVLKAVEAISPEADQNLFIDHNRRPFSEPPNFHFEPCAIWHDTPDFLISQHDAKVLLQNRLAKARAKTTDLETAIDAKRKDIASSEKLRDKYVEKELGDVDDVVENGLEVARQSMLLEMQLTSAVREGEVIEEALGADQGSLQPHSFKSTSFIQPVVCNFCQDKIWGLNKNGATCKACGFHAHQKCVSKVPADCVGAIQQTGRRRQASLAASTAATFQQAWTPMSIAAGTSSIGSAGGVGPGAPLDRTTTGSSARRMPPPVPGKRTSIDTTANRLSGTTLVDRNPSLASRPSPRTPSSASRTSTSSRTGKALYDFEATTDGQVTVEESEQVSVISADNGSGWATIETADGRSGLVPANYLEIGAPEPKRHSRPAPPPPTRKPQRKRARAIYDWSPKTEDEHALQEGEVVTLTEDGESFSEGWYEIEKDGREGIVPSSYVELL